MMEKGRSPLLFICVAAGLLLAGALVSHAGAQGTGVDLVPGPEDMREVQILESDLDRILFEVKVPQYVLTQQWVNGRVYDVVVYPGLGVHFRAWQPPASYAARTAGHPAGG